MHFVYFLQSESAPERFYCGGTENLEARLAQHNRGESPHTVQWMPWKMTACMGFAEKEKADAFQKYIRTPAGRAFTDRHF